MQYLIARDGTQLGQFSEEEVRSGLFEGRYLTTDVAWTEGMQDWKPLGEIMGQGVTRIAGPRQVGGSSLPSFSGPAPKAGLAIAALILGILALLTCGLFGLTAVSAIVCGHLALSKINKSGGALGGRGMAITGLVMGYVSVLLIVVSIMASLSMGAIGKMSEKGEIINGINAARNLVMATKIYAMDKEDGKYPATLEELVTAATLEKDAFDKAQSFKPKSWLGEPGFEYLGAGLSEDAPPKKPIVRSRSRSKDGKRIVGTNDGAVEVVKE